MNAILGITLGILSAMGGFVDIGDLVFSVQAGVNFNYTLLWALLIGTLGIILFTEMSGRVAAITHKPVFTTIKENLPKQLSISVLIASTLLNVLTCAAEIGGVAIALQLLTGIATSAAMLITIAVFIILIWLLPFTFLEKSFGILGLCMIVFLAANIATHINGQQTLHGLFPHIPKGGTDPILLYCYFAVGLISSSMMPYELYFYSSGAIEEKWKPKNLKENFLTATVGMIFGGFISASLLMTGAKILAPAGVVPQLHGTAALLAAIPLGQTGLYLALLGIMFAVGGAALETGLSGAYSLAQYFNWRWGLEKKREYTSKFTWTWLAIFVSAFIILMTGVDPVQLVEYAVIFSVLSLPFTYYPVFRVAANKNIMGKNANKQFLNILGWIFFAVIVIVALAAVPLMIATNLGQQ